MWGKKGFFLPNYTALENAVICVIERLLSEYHTTDNPKWEYACMYPGRAGVELKVRKTGL